MVETTRRRRTLPDRTEPIRNASAASAPKSAETAPKQKSDDGLDLAVSDAIAQAVRLGYRVLAENLEEGRTAAKQFRVGEYSARNVPGDLNLLAKRMVNLARDLSTTTFDVLDRVLQDPALMKAARRMADAVEPAAIAAKPSAASPTKKTAPAATKSSGKSAPASSAPTPKLIPLSCRFSGPGDAKMLAAWLTSPDSPTPLATAGLTTLGAGVAPITGVTFHASDDGLSVIADVMIAKDQPAGIYSGAVVGIDDGKAIGTLTIQVGA